MKIKVQREAVNSHTVSDRGTPSVELSVDDQQQCSELCLSRHWVPVQLTDEGFTEAGDKNCCSTLGTLKRCHSG